MHHLSPRLGAMTIATGALLVLGGCADQPTEITRMADPAAALFSASSSNGFPQFVANSVQYQNTSKPNATGRAGSAAMTARALRAADGTTLLEVTTGELDSDVVAPGNLDKVQVKAIVDPDEDPLFTDNNNKLRAGGYFSEVYQGLAQGVTVQTQANVSGIDRNRVGVVTLSETVKLRPDLDVDVSAAPQAAINTAVHVAGTVTEINGDVGATTSCVLYVDGAEADRADGVWVNNGGSVSCAFVTSFAAAGTYEVTVAAENVVPGDWDTANNSASVSIEALEPTVQMHGHANAQDIFYDYNWGWTYASSYPTFQYVHRQLGRNQRYWAVGYTNESFTYPVDVELVEQSGGVTVNSLSFQNVSDNYWYYHCSYVFDAGTYVYVCPTYGYTNYGRYAGTVTYFSTNYAQWTGSSFNVYSWNYDGTSSNYSFATWANDVNPKLTITSANGKQYVSNPQITLNPYNYSSSGASCYYWYYNECYASTYTQSGKIGSTSF